MRLFSHPLYNIQTPALGPEERLLQVEQLIDYYRRKVSHWERSVSGVVFHHSKIKILFVVTTMPLILQCVT